MERLLTPVLGGEFSRHFWPGLFFGLLIASASALNGLVPTLDRESLIPLLAVVVPVVVLLGVLIDFVGHIFVQSPVCRLEALTHLGLASTVLTLIKRRLRPILGTEVDSYDLNLLSEYCFSLTRAVSTNAIAHQKYEEQFTYFEFNRSFSLFFVPLIFYNILLVVFQATPLGDELSDKRAVLFICYVLAQCLTLLLAVLVFRQRDVSARLYPLARWYFGPVFGVYAVVTTVQLGMLYDYFLSGVSTACTSTPTDSAAPARPESSVPPANVGKT